MYHHLSLAVRDRIIRELRAYWSDHPRYEDFAKNIQGKYSFEERPQFGMVVKTSGASNVVLSPNNFIATVEGFVSLAKVPDKTYGSIEWVREDTFKPREPGVYIISVYEPDHTDPSVREHDVYVQKYVRNVESSPTFISKTEIMLSDLPIEDSLRVLEYPSGRSLGLSEYILEEDKVTLLEEPSKALSYKVLYTSKKEQTGPFKVRPAMAYREIVEGVNIVFGRRLRGGDEMAIIVTEDREEVAHEYGGRWDVSVDLDMIARDVHSQADIADNTAVWIWSTLRPRLATMGIELSDVSLGGEAEEVYDDNGDDYFYTASISFTLQTDWFLHYPLVTPIQSISRQGIQLDTLEKPVVGLGNRSLIQRLL
jgi:hypothetical protein